MLRIQPMSNQNVYKVQKGNNSNVNFKGSLSERQILVGEGKEYKDYAIKKIKEATQDSAIIKNFTTELGNISTKFFGSSDMSYASLDDFKDKVSGLLKKYLGYVPSPYDDYAKEPQAVLVNNYLQKVRLEIKDENLQKMFARDLACAHWNFEMDKPVIDNPARFDAFKTEIEGYFNKYLELDKKKC